METALESKREERGIMLKKLGEEDAHLEAHFFIPKRDK